MLVFLDCSLFVYSKNYTERRSLKDRFLKHHDLGVASIPNRIGPVPIKANYKQSTVKGISGDLKAEIKDQDYLRFRLSLAVSEKNTTIVAA